MKILYKMLIVCFSLVLTCLTLFSPLKANASESVLDNLKFYGASSLQTVKRNEPMTDRAEISTLSVSAAKGETEGAQFIVSASKDISNYDVSVTDLVLDADNKIEATDIIVYVEIYTEAVSSVLFVGTNGAGTYPDCLIPIDYIKTANENKIKQGDNQGFWIDFKIPLNVKSGIYKGNVKFTVGNQEKKIPVSLTVYDFNMPESPALATCYLTWNDWLLDAEFDNTTEKQWTYFDKLLEYNISAYVFPSKDTKDFVRALTKYYGKVNMYGIPYRAISKTVNDWEYYMTYMLAIGEQCKKDNINYFDKAYYYFDMFYDEATSFDWRIEQLKEIILITDQCEESIINELIEPNTIIDGTDCEVANSIRNLKHSITTEKYMDDTWKGILDMYVQHSNGFTTTAGIQKYEEILGDGDYTVWSYTTELCDYPNPTVSIAGIPVTARDMYWYDYQIGVTGELYWCSNCNVNISNDLGLRYAPIFDPYHQASHDGVSNGGGYYLYPGVHYGSNEPFPSMRLAVKRDGIDDYAYMKELEKRYCSVGRYDSARKLVSFMNEVIIKSNRSMLNGDGLYKARENLAKLIEAFDKCGLVINDIAYLDDGIYVDVSSNAEVLKINGKEYTTSNVIEKITDYDNLTVSCKKYDYEDAVVFETKKQATLVNDFENVENNVVKVQNNYSSTVSLDSTVTHSGNYSSKAVLSGYTDFDNLNYILSYKPSAYFDIKDVGLTNGLNDCNYIEFYLYNDGEEREYEVYVQSLVDGITKTVIYDRIVLKPKQWTKIEIDNFNIVSLDKNDYKNVFRVGVRTNNLFTENGVYTQTVYIDDISVGYKK